MWYVACGMALDTQIGMSSATAYGNTIGDYIATIIITAIMAATGTEIRQSRRLISWPS